MVNLVALHGFWGKPGDFDGVLEALNPTRTFVPDLYAHGPLDPTHDFSTWTQTFCAAVAERFKGEPVVLVGYSMGGRLALHALASRPDLFQSAVLISVNPGPLIGREQPARVQWIRDWSGKFRNEDWESVEREWNAQEAFFGSERPRRRRPDRSLLIRSLQNWSLLEHRIQLTDVIGLKIPVCWAFGALDKKFLAVKESLLREGVPGEFHVIERAGHRVPMDAPVEVVNLIKDQIKQRKEIQCQGIL